MKRRIDAALSYSTDLGGPEHARLFLKRPSDRGTRYNHAVHGEMTIVAHRPIYGRDGKPLPAPFIEVQLDNEQASFWTGACHLDTMELV